VHTRIDETIAKVIDNVNAGNVYVNRNIVGAVVGVQPFGGEGLSGTGPKAGGPLYLYRLLSTRPTDAIEQSFARGDASCAPDVRLRDAMSKPLTALKAWADSNSSQPERPVRAVRRAVAKRHHPPAGRPDRRAQQLRDPAARARAVPGGRRRRSADPTGGGAGGWRFGGMAGSRADQGLVRTPAEGHSGAIKRWPTGTRTKWCSMRSCITAIPTSCARSASKWPSAVVRSLGSGLVPGRDNIALERLVIERALSVNTAAAGGNASLMTIG
jgi:RHH-type proline utilization regulon transcriptional repressor/proline dehydrogenase/delta 1-pyrroline-5-carboxylate dehydrogenase